MARAVTEYSFFQYLNCPSWVYFDAHAKEPRPHAVLMKLLQTNGLLDEHKRSFWAAREDVVEVLSEDQEEAYAQTLAYMKDGHQAIVGAVLMDRHWIGRPDILERVEGKSVFGSYYYVACDTKHTSEPLDVHKLQGCFYAELLYRIQGVKPVQGYIITHKKESLSYDIASYEDRFRLTLEEIEKILAGKIPEHFLSSGCKSSPWFYECFEETQSCQDVSLLNRIWREEARLLRDAGITTIPELARLSLGELEERVPGMALDRIKMIRDQAEALAEQKVIIRHPIVLPNEPEVLYFDIESDPLRDWDYLFGVLRVDGDKERYHPFFSHTAAKEGEIWKAFTSFIAEHPRAIIYHYGEFERQVVARFIAKYGIDAGVLETLERGMVDLLDHLRPAVVFPLPFYSLKDLATYMGFTWRDGDASGANSVLWFEEWLKTADEATKERIMMYNEDDVRATRVVREWIRLHAEPLI